VFKTLAEGMEELNNMMGGRDPEEQERISKAMGKRIQRMDRIDSPNHMLYPRPEDVSPTV